MDEKDGSLSNIKGRTVLVEPAYKYTEQGQIDTFRREYLSQIENNKQIN